MGLATLAVFGPGWNINAQKTADNNGILDFCWQPNKTIAGRGNFLGCYRCTTELRKGVRMWSCLVATCITKDVYCLGMLAVFDATSPGNDPTPNHIRTHLHNSVNVIKCCKERYGVLNGQRKWRLLNALAGNCVAGNSTLSGLPSSSGSEADAEKDGERREESTNPDQNRLGTY